MTLEQKDKISLSDIRMKKAYEFLQDAKANSEDGRYNTSINRSYYAALYAVRSILILEGANPETHEGVITMLSLRFIKSKLLPVDIIKNFKTLLSRRTDVDYGDFETIDKAESEDSTLLAEEIITTTDHVRKEIIAKYTS
jgi:uncharacterized protein (UPF0332 family)